MIHYLQNGGKKEIGHIFSVTGKLKDEALKNQSKRLIVEFEIENEKLAKNHRKKWTSISLFGDYKSELFTS